MPPEIQFVKNFQAEYNRFVSRMKLGRNHITVDGLHGEETKTAWEDARYHLGWSEKYVSEPMTSERTKRVIALMKRPLALSPRPQWVRGLRRRRATRKLNQLSVGHRAYNAALPLVGIMEHGGNNRGAEVEKIVRSVGGAIGAPWCGYFVAYCYKLAGKSIENIGKWGYVPYMSAITGVHRTSNPSLGDIVRFGFGHTGLFVNDNNDGTITTIEGNTGASGAVSDSSTGGDGVYRKIRSKSLVQDYLTFR